MEDNIDKDDRINNVPIKSIIKQRIISSTTTTSTFTQQHQHHEYRNKNKKYNNDKYWKENNNNKYNNNYYNNRSQYNPSLNLNYSQQKQNYYHQNYKKKLYQDSLEEFIFDPDIPCKLIDFVGGVNYTPSNDNGVIFRRVVNFFKNLITNIEEKKMVDFGFYLQENQGFYVKIIQSDPTRHPPRKTVNCISCDTESETNKISKLPYPTTTREEVSIHHNLWVDAKARSMFIITPKRHVERLSECNDQEIFSMFLLATQIIEQETRLSNANWNGIRFLRMTLNHGNARNVEHLHLKIKISNKDFNHFQNCWDEERMKNFKILKNGLYKRDERLAKIS
ncbi:hypothetical protein C1645_412132 [Glomus cerebriforme]|uniref:HIT-like domain-containing protein n=1 Tax=Glomus cerebriforme TaxID=658196 RepID=A0A397SNX9_9GLOM|nr:hypothetical protein C1645_412132 [Glomus cerebriforme]